MKAKRIVLAAVLTTLLVLSTAIVGCDEYLMYEVGIMMDRFPADVEDFEFIDTNDIEDDDDLESIYNDWMANVSSSLELFGIEADDVDAYASGGGVEIFKDGFKTKDLKAKLVESGYEQRTYRDGEVWKNTDCVALIEDGLVIIGTESGVKSCIDVIVYDEESLLDNDDARDVITDINMLNLAIYHRESGGLTTLVASGASFWDRKDTLKAHLIFKFESKAAAKAAVDDIEAEFAHLDDLDVDQDDEYVDVFGEMPIDEW